jgi:hypothetical protein
MNEQMVHAAFGSARESAAETVDDLRKDAEIDAVSEDNVSPRNDPTERQR